MSGLKIILVNDNVHGGGVENMLQNLTAYFVKKGYSVSILASPQKRKEFHEYLDPNVVCIRHSWPRKKFQRFGIPFVVNRVNCKLYHFYIQLRLSLTRYDIALAFKEGPIMKKALSVKAGRKFAWVHCDYAYMHQAYLTWVRGCFASDQDELECMKQYEKVVCVSETAKESVIRAIGDPGNLCVKYDPINWEKIVSASQEPCPLSRDPSRPLIVSVGRLDTVKNYLTLLKACEKLQKTTCFDLWIAGEGNERSNLEEYITAHALSFVKLLGVQKNPYSILRQATLFVSSSVSESYGLSVQEALILGIPVVAVNCPGIAEWFDPRFGLLVNNSAEELADAMGKMLNDSSMLSAYQKAIAQHDFWHGVYEDRMEKICQLWETP